MNNKEKAVALLASILEIDSASLTDNTTFIDIEGWDSLAHLQIIGEFEEVFKVKIPIEKIPDIKAVKDLLNFLD